MTYKRYFVSLEAESPLLIGAAQTLGNYRPSAEVIPGRTWRGALATALRQEQPSLFQTLFENAAEEAHFGPLFPALGDTVTIPAATRFSCKRYPGLNARGRTDDEHHGTFDTLVRLYAFEVASHEANDGRLPSTIDELRCPQCGSLAELYDEPEVQVQRSSTTHVAINRARRVAEEGQLYTREGVRLKGARVYYNGWLDVPDELESDLLPALDGRELHIGGNRSRGMGFTRVRVVNESSSRSDDLPARVQALNLTLQNALHHYSRQTGIIYPALDSARAGRYFTLDLHGEAVLLKDGLPTSDIAFGRADIVIERRWIAWQTVGGWHAAAGLPRRSAAAVSGCYLCRFTDEVDMQFLNDLEIMGIGVMREQGYGQLTICAPVHEQTGE